MVDTDNLSLKEKYDRDGFVVIPNLIPADERAALEDACERVINKTRAGAWTQRRVVGKQFPPYDTETNPDSWGVQHVMHPELNEPAFAKWYTSDPLIDAAKELLQCNEDELQMELFNLLINPLSHEFALRWHRDDVKETASADEERAALAIWSHGVQWNTALYADACLYVVPGSHNTPRTSAQHAHSCTQTPPTDPLAMPGAIRVALAPGESVFYNNNILHCATYDPRARRATLHASMGSTKGGAARARNVLQHGLAWMREERFREGLPTERGRRMLERLVEMEKSVGGPVGYSLE